jgi:hypothetical protein
VVPAAAPPNKEIGFLRVLQQDVVLSPILNEVKLEKERQQDKHKQASPDNKHCCFLFQVTPQLQDTVLSERLQPILHHNIESTPEKRRTRRCGIAQKKKHLSGLATNQALEN